MRKSYCLMIVLFWMISLVLLQGCVVDKPFVKKDLKSIDFIKVARHEPPIFRKYTSATKGVRDLGTALVIVAPVVGPAMYLISATALLVSEGVSTIGGKIKEGQLSILDFGEIVMKKFTQSVRKEIPQWPMMIIKKSPIDQNYSHESGILLEFRVIDWGVRYEGMYAPTEGFFTTTNVKMVDHEGKVLWERTFRYESEEFARSLTLEEFEANNGKLLKEEIEFAAERTVTDFIEYFINENRENAKAPVFLKSWGKEGNKPGELNSPNKMAIGSDGLIYVADKNNHRIQAFDSEGNLIRNWGKKGSLDGEMKEPQAIAVGSDGAVYVSDNGNRRILKFDRNGNQIARLGDKNTVSSNITGIAVDAKGNIYTVDTDKHRIVIFDQKGEVIKTIGKKGKASGMMEDPSAIAIDQFGNIYVVDSSNKRIQKFGANGNFSKLFGNEMELDSPTGLGLAKNGNIYLTDKGLGQIFVYDSTGMLIVNWKRMNENEQFDEPTDVVIDDAGNVYIIDVNKTNKLLKFKAGK